MKEVISHNWKKYLFFFFLLVLSTVLMINFKHKKNLQNFYGEAKEKISSYIKNLKPIFTKTNITNEDIFNFAFYKSLPLDREEGKVLLINNNNGEDIIEIKNLPIKKTQNLNSYLNFLASNDKDKNKIDSLLNFYRTSIYQNIFIGDDSYAVNPEIILLRENLITDLLSISQKINKNKARELFSLDNFKSLKKMSYENHLKNKMEFLLITKDTVYVTKFSFDKKKLQKQIIEADKDGLNLISEIDKPIAKIKLVFDDNTRMKNINQFKIDTNDVKITLNKEMINKNLNDSLRKVLDENITKRIQLFANDRAIKNLQSTKELVKFSNPNEIANATINLVRELNISNKVNEALRKDSSYFNLVIDSIKIKKMHEEIRKANKKLKRLNLDTIKIK